MPRIQDYYIITAIFLIFIIAFGVVYHYNNQIITQPIKAYYKAQWRAEPPSMQWASTQKDVIHSLPCSFNVGMENFTKHRPIDKRILYYYYMREDEKILFSFNSTIGIEFKVAVGEKPKWELGNMLMITDLFNSTSISDSYTSSGDYVICFRFTSINYTTSKVFFSAISVKKGYR